MLTETQYKELARYRLDDIPDDGVWNETVRFLSRKKYIIRYWPMDAGKHSGTLMRAITEPGRAALEEYESHMSEKRAEEEKIRNR